MGAGFAGLALTGLLSRDGFFERIGLGAETGSVTNPLTSRPSHSFGKAKSVIFLMMNGAPSQVDTFDHKPLLEKLAGQPLPEGKKFTNSGGRKIGFLTPSFRPFRPGGQSGLMISDFFENVRGHADKLAVIRSCHTDSHAHGSALVAMNTGKTIIGRPSLGSWATYGLGSENANLPAFVVMQDCQGQVVNGPRNWRAGVMPAVYQGIRIQGRREPIPNLHTPEGVADAQQRGKLDLLGQMNRKYAAEHPEQSELDARMASYEMAFRMQAEAPEAVDLTKETEETKKLYGLEGKETATMGRLCLLARRMVERGVRFVQIYHGAGSKWDAHSKLESNHGGLCKSMDQPVAALLKDLKRRGLLDTTLV
ncbi:MAG: DUF1501 domain-containing protein, partial [Hyphomicrobiales bacterium]